MLEKAKHAVDGLKDEIQKKKLERELAQKQKEQEENRKKETMAKQEREKLKEEYDRLSGLEDRQLMVELIFAVRGFYTENENLKRQCQELGEQMKNLEQEIYELNLELNSMRSD